MSEEHASGFRFYSFGIVVETKPEGTDYILASPVEELYLQESGVIREKTKDFKGKKKSVSSVNFQTEHESKNFIRAKWVDISGGNRVTPPDVVVNETVLLMKYGNVDEYFWCTFGREPELRRLEDVLYSFSNLPSGIKAYDKNTSYWVHVSTKHKFVHIHTSMNDGEFTTYDIKLDTKAGKLLINDAVGDSIELDSPAGRITTIARSEIIRKAPKITDISETHTINTKTYTNNAKSITNNSPIVTNTGNVVTKGSDTANFNLNAKCVCPNCR